MCGFTGFIDFKGNLIDYEKILKQSSNLINFRGPDESKNLILNELGIYLTFNRLSMIDLTENGSQPMFSFSRDSLILFNGEIYNFSELKKILSTKMYLNDQISDTRIALEYIENYGVNNFLELCEGMFSIVFINLVEKEIFFLSDPFCQKPLYYSLQNNRLFFSSDLRTIHTNSKFNKTIDKKSIPQFFKKNCIHSPNTIYEKVKKISKGEKILIKFKNKNLSHPKSEIYYNYQSKFPISYDQNFSINQFNEIMIDSIKKHLISDVPISVFLSSGLDSSLILALTKELSVSTESHTIGFEEIKFDESNNAKKISDYLGVKNNRYVLSKKNILDTVNKLPDIYSEPFSDSSQIPYSFLCSNTSKHFKGVLCGDGGDELFGGYLRHNFGVKLFESKNKFFISGIMKILSNSKLKKILEKTSVVYLNEKLDRLSNSLSQKDIYNFYNSLTSHFHFNEMFANSNSYKNTKFDNLNDNHKLMMLYDLQNFLTNDLMVKSDRASMFSSLEVRSPFLSKKVFEYSAKLDSKLFFRNGYKSPIRELLNLYLPKKLIQNKKKGFSLPIKEILKTDLKEHLDYYLSDNLLSHNFFDKNFIKKTIKDFFNNNTDSQYAIWDLLMFQMWFDKYHRI